MAVKVVDSAVEPESRLALVALSALTLREMELWRNSIATVLGEQPDYESVMIIGAVLAIGGEKLLRLDLPEPLHDLAQPIPLEMLTRCNQASVAATTGLNRETVRRKIRRLIDKGILMEHEGSVRIAHGLLQLPIARETVFKQLQALERTVCLLTRLGILRPASR